MAANDKAATGQLAAAYRVPSARAPEYAAPHPRPDRERYAWLYDDEDIWAVAEVDDVPSACLARPRHRRPG